MADDLSRAKMEAVLLKGKLSLARAELRESNFENLTIKATHRIKMIAQERLLTNKEHQLTRALEIAATPQEVATARLPRDPQPFAVVANSYINERLTEDIKSNTKNVVRAKVQFWIDYFGETQAHDIDKPLLKKIREAISNLPKHWEQKGMSANQVMDIALGGKHDYETIGRSTVTDYLRPLWDILNTAVDIGSALETPPKLDMKKRRGKRTETPQRPYDDTEASTILSWENLSGRHLGGSSNQEALIGRFWITLILAFSGARRSEVAQLLVKDCKKCNISGIKYFNLTEEEDSATIKKSLKNTNSKRRIPIHSALIEMGFWDFVEERKARGSDQDWLFPWPMNLANSAAAFTKWYARDERRSDGGAVLGYIEKIGIKSRGDGWRKTTHAWRHTVATKLSQCKRESGSLTGFHEVSSLLGHMDQDELSTIKKLLPRTETGRYDHSESTLEGLRETVELIKYPQINFSDFNWAAFKSSRLCI